MVHPPHPEIKELEYNYITDGIYIGSNQCCQTHLEEGLVKEGITADISVEEDKIDMPFGADFYLWLPVKDHSPPTPEQMDLGVGALEKLTFLKRKIYVHCKNGHGRAPTLVAAYLIKKGGTPEEAVNFIKERRPSIHLQESQKEALKLYYEKNGSGRKANSEESRT